MAAAAGRARGRGADRRLAPRIEAELVFAGDGETLLYATFVRLEGELARAAWAQVERIHPPMVRRLLEASGAR